MSAIPVPQTTLTLSEYLAIERQAEFKSEFFNGRTYEMSGASRIHNRIKDNLIVEIGNRLKGSPCQTFSSDMKVLVERTGNVFYPDVIICCEPTEVLDEHGDAILNPTVIFEILSPSTEAFDRGRKFLNYQRIPSLKEYVLISQEVPLLQRYVRQEDDNWLMMTSDGINASFSCFAVTPSIPLASLYARIEFTATGPELK